MGLRQGGPLLVETARLLHDGCGLAEQDGIASEAKDKIGPAPMGDHVDDLRGGKMAVPADQDMGVGPVAPQIGRSRTKIMAFSAPGGAGARAEVGGHQGVRGPFENEERQIAIVLIVMVIEGEFLLAMRRIIGVIEVEHNGGGGLGVAGDEVVHQGRGEPIEVLAVHAGVQDARRSGHSPSPASGSKGQPLHAELKHGVMPEAIGIIAVRIARGDLIDTLGQEVPQGMVNIGRMPLIMDGGGQAFGEANLAVDPAQQEGTKVRRQGATLEIGPEGMTQRREENRVVLG